MLRNNGEKLLKILRENLTINPDDYLAYKVAIETGDIFKILIATILTQNTSDKNAIKAYNNLARRFDITPEALCNASLSEIEDAIKIAGLYRRRAKLIKKISCIIMDKFNGDLNSILNLSADEARKILISLPGVGNKTADVILLFKFNAKTFPIDTHINRVSKRIGIAPKNANYNITKQCLMNFFPENSYLEAHLLLIALGRKYCRALKPLCNDCPIKYYCKYHGEIAK